MHVTLDEHATTPLYDQIYTSLRERIVVGDAAPGARLPSQRELASQLSVARTTVVRAADALCAEGYIMAEPRSGLRVALELPIEPGRPLVEPAPPRAPRTTEPSTRPFRLGVSAELLKGGDGAGHAGLRRAIAAHVATARGVTCDPQQIFIASGTAPGIEEVLGHGIEPGDAVWVEDPRIQASASRCSPRAGFTSPCR